MCLYVCRGERFVWKVEGQREQNEDNVWSDNVSYIEPHKLEIEKGDVPLSPDTTIMLCVVCYALDGGRIRSSQSFVFVSFIKVRKK